jgi:hypothetical protein
MSSRSRVARFGWFLAAVFQILLPTFVSVADSRAEAASIREASVHIEATGTAGCPAVHSDNCAVCHVLAAGARAARPVALQIAAVRVISAPAVRHTWSVWGAIAPGDPPQRAPPTLS